jgi:hypothetical protein
MGFRFYRRVHLAPGLSVNFSRSGPSLSVGVRGAHMTVGRSGVTRTVGLPGTGLFYTSRVGHHTGYHSLAGGAERTKEQQAHDARRVGTTLLFVALAFIAGLAVAASWVR